MSDDQSIELGIDLPAGSSHHELIELFEENLDGEQPVLSAHRQVEAETENDIVFLMFSDEVSTIYKQLKDKIEDLGYELYAFGNNRALFNNLTAAFAKVEE